MDVEDFNVEAGHNCSSCGFMNCSSCGFMLTEDMDNLPKFEDRMSEYQIYGAFVNDLNHGGLTIPGDSAC